MILSSFLFFLLSCESCSVEALEFNRKVFFSFLRNLSTILDLNCLKHILFWLNSISKLRYEGVNDTVASSLSLKDDKESKQYRPRMSVKAFFLRMFRDPQLVFTVIWRRPMN